MSGAPPSQRGDEKRPGFCLPPAAGARPESADDLGDLVTAPAPPGEEQISECPRKGSESRQWPVHIIRAGNFSGA